MALAVLASIYVALFVYFVAANVITQPYWDMLSIITRYLQYERDGNLWAYLWEPHVQHRHVWMRVLTAFDAAVFSGIAYPFVIVAVACQAVTAWLLWREARAGVPGEQGRWLGWLVVMLVMTSVAAVDCAIPMNGIYPQTVMFSVLALVLFDTGEQHDRRMRSTQRVLAVAAAIAAAFGNAAALCLWPILIWLAWKSHAPRAWTAALAAVAVLFGSAYLYRLPGAAVGDGSPFAAAQLSRAADYLVTYLGLPWTRSAALLTPGKILGTFLLVVSSALVIGALRRPVTSRVERLALSLIAFSTAIAVLAAFGRSGLDADMRVPVRYAVLVAPMHVGLLLLAWPRLASWPAFVARPSALYAGALMLALVLVAQQIVSGRAAVATTTAMRATLARFAAGEATDDMRTVVFVDLSQARRDLNAIHAAGLYLTGP